MFSIIVCSIRPAEAEALRQNIAATIGDVPFEFIAYDNRGTGKGIAEVYNECASRAKYDLLCFAHEDIEFRSEGWGRDIASKLEEQGTGVIGFAGSTYKSAYPTGWLCTRRWGVRMNYVQGRGESEELFEQAYNFIKGLDISQLHVFSYSERPGTKALSIEGAVSPAEKHRRSRMLIELSEEKRIAFYERSIGKEAVVLFEKPRPSMPMGGFTANYIRVECEPVKEYVNCLVRVRLGGFNSDKSALTVDEIIGVE